MKLNKKGFTIVELIIVIVIIAILAAVLIPVFTNMIRSARANAALQLVRNLNTALRVDKPDGLHPTMQSALDAAAEAGYDIAKINENKTDNEILWDSKNDAFCYLLDGEIYYVPEAAVKYQKAATAEYDDEKVNKVDYFRIANAVDQNSEYSTYLYGYTGASAIETSKGLDVGTSSVAAINYNGGASAQTVIIRTNSAATALTIDAQSATVKHYDSVGKVNIEKIDMNCYEEYGTAAYVKVTEGKVVAKAGGKITVVFADNTDGDKVAVIKESGAEIGAGYTKAAEVDTENRKRTDGIALAYQIDNANITGESSIQTVINDAVNEAIANTEYTGVAVIKSGEATQLMTLEAFRDAVNEGNSFAGSTVKLLDNIDLENVNWTPIGTSANPFSGVFDGQGYKISNLTVNSTSGYAGLFGNVTGTAADAPHTSNGVWDSSSNTVILNSYSEDKYTAGVKNLVIDGFAITNTSGNYVGTVVAYGKDAYFANLTVKNGTVNGNGKTGGVIGATGENVVLDYLSTESSVTVSATEHSVGGIIGGVNRGGKTSHLAVIANCTNRANVSTTDTSNGIAAGILGHGGSTSGLNVAIINCANYGEIKCQTRTAGIVAQAQKVKLILSCVNNGKIWNEATGGNNILGGIAGECDTNGLQIVACMNNGQVTGYANDGKIAGIIGSIQNADLIEGCVNTGSITNTKANGTYSDITSGAANVLVANEATYTVDSSVSGEMTSVTITGGAVTCTSIVIDNAAIEKVFVAIDNFNGTITGLAGKTLYICGADNIVTIPQGTAVEKVVVSGANCTIINNGTVGTIRFEVAGNHSIENNGTIANTTDFAFTISSTVNGVNVAITNNGTIAASGSKGAYALYFGSGATCTVNNHGTITGDNFGKVTVN